VLNRCARRDCGRHFSPYNHYQLSVSLLISKQVSRRSSVSNVTIHPPKSFWLIHLTQIFTALAGSSLKRGKTRIRFCTTKAQIMRMQINARTRLKERSYFKVSLHMYACVSVCLCLDNHSLWCLSNRLSQNPLPGLCLIARNYTANLHHLEHGVAHTHMQCRGDN